MTRKYKINSIKDLQGNDKTDDYSKERIDKTGSFYTPFGIGTHLNFIYDDPPDKMMVSTEVENVQEFCSGNKYIIKTKNSVYEFERLS